MQAIRNRQALTELIQQWRRLGETIAFVPTMGNLHAGHLALVKQAASLADRVVVSIFVNPTQFCPGEDFDNYPRTEQADAEKLAAENVDLLFLPMLAEMYPQPAIVSLTVGELANRYCGKSRPGHFDGVVTVVCKLFNMVQPDLAVFGEKDFQQLAIIRRMVADLNMPVQIIGAPLVRESDGLAMSSRNGYLTAEQRKLAPVLYQLLQRLRNEILDGREDWDDLLEQYRQHLNAAGFKTDYLAISRVDDLLQATPKDHDLVILAAACLGKTRLIDNLPFHR